MLPSKWYLSSVFKYHFVFPALLPDQPTNLTVTNIKSRSAEIAWMDPVNTGDGDLEGFWIKLIKNGSLIQNIIINKVNQHTLSNLIPYTTYEISVAAGNKHGFGEETSTSFSTSEEGGNGMSIFSSFVIMLVFTQQAIFNKDIFFTQLTLFNIYSDA